MVKGGFFILTSIVYGMIVYNNNAEALETSVSFFRL